MKERKLMRHAEEKHHQKTSPYARMIDLKICIVFQILASITKPQKIGRSEIFSLE